MLLLQSAVSTLPGLHKLRRLRLVRRIQKLGHDERKLLEFYRLRNIRVEAGVDALCVDVPEDICRKCNDGVSSVSVFLFPSTDLLAGLVAVFVGHVQVALG